MKVKRLGVALLMLAAACLAPVTVSARGWRSATLCGCDVNCDGEVNLVDLVLIAIRYGQTVPLGTREDTNQDGKVNLFDLICITTNYDVPVPDVDPGAPVVKISISRSNFDAPGDDGCNLNEEFVSFEHAGGSAVNLEGWSVKDEQNHVYTFPSFTLLPKWGVRLRSGHGDNSAVDLYWGAPEEVWDNDGDSVFLYNPSGILVDARIY